MTVAKVDIKGLREFQAALKSMDSNLPKQLRVALNKAADVVIDYAQARMPSKTGAARASLKARSSQREARVGMGGRKAPYAPWLDFGGEGRVKGRPAKRTFIREGRYVYKGLEANRPEVIDIMRKAIEDLARQSGAGVD